FWSTAPLLGNGETTLRCSVDGKKLPDFKSQVGSVMAAGQRQVQVDLNINGQTPQYRYDHLEVHPAFRFGPRDDSGTHDAKVVPWSIDPPGKWDCFLRKDGKNVREFMFTVNDKGMVEPSAMQTGAHPVPTPPGTVLIDMRIPADNGLERRIRPDAMKKG